MNSMENDPLATYLNALERDECYRAEKVLKEAPHEVTELVYLAGAGGAQRGPFVRKRIRSEAEMGKGYAHLLEAQRAGRHFSHLPHIYDVHQRDGELVVVMEYVEGCTLREEVYRRDPSPQLAAQWFPALCDGVAELHGLAPAPLIHRDLKPTNILVGSGKLTVIDLGIARSFRDGAEADTTHFGTRSYAPPEQFGYGQTDVRSDVYAMGMILYYLLTECDPSPAMVREGFADERIPAPLQAVLARACAFDPAARYQTVGQLKKAFLSAMAKLEAAQGRGKSVGPAPGGSGPAAPNSSGPKPHAERPEAAPSRPSLVAGMVWNGALALVWAFFVVVALVAIFVPSVGDASLPPWFRILEYGGIFALPVTGIAYALLDKRWLRRRISALAGQTFRKGLVVGLKLVALGAIVLVACIFFVACGVVRLPGAGA